MDKEYLISTITAKVNEFITEISENSKAHASFIQDNTKMVVFGAETALDIMKETICDLNDNSLQMNHKLKPCPFCGNEVTLTKDPLWKGSHGYVGDYEFNIKCEKCGCNIYLKQNDTIYRTEDEAMKNAINQWNKRTYKNNDCDDCIKNGGDWDCDHIHCRKGNRKDNNI